MSYVQRHKGILPLLLLLPGLAWLVVFFAVPLYYQAKISLNTGTPFEGFHFAWHWSTYTDAISQYHTQFIRSFIYAGASTALSLLIGYPLAYAIAFRGGRWRNALLLAVILPFFVTYLVRTLAWETILDDSSPLVSFLQTLGIVGHNGHVLATTGAVIAGITYNFLPFMILPLYASLERIDFPTAAALSFTLMAIILVMVAIWAKVAGTEALMGSEAR